MLERSITVGDNGLPFREELADIVDGFPEDRREIVPLPDRT